MRPGERSTAAAITTDPGVYKFQPTVRPSDSQVVYMGRASDDAYCATSLYAVDPHMGATHRSIYDLRGRLVKAWASADLPAGGHSQQWNLTDASGRTVGAGVYFVHLDTAWGRVVRALVRIP